MIDWNIEDVRISRATTKDFAICLGAEKKDTEDWGYDEYIGVEIYEFVWELRLTHSGTKEIANHGFRLSSFSDIEDWIDEQRKAKRKVGWGAGLPDIAKGWRQCGCYAAQIVWDTDMVLRMVCNRLGMDPKELAQCDESIVARARDEVFNFFLSVYKQTGDTPSKAPVCDHIEWESGLRVKANEGMRWWIDRCLASRVEDPIEDNVSEKVEPTPMIQGELFPI